MSGETRNGGLLVGGKGLRATLGIVAAAALVGCGADLPFGPQFAQGIDGVALIGPQCPVQSVANPCPDLPHQAQIDVTDPGGRLVVRLRSDSAGEFRVGLRPGDYILRPKGGTPFPAVSDQPVLVRPDEYTEVVVSFDTGIR